MSEPLPIRTGGDGNEYYWQSYIEVGGNWVSGCNHDDGPDMATWDRLTREAAVIASALAPADTVERQMALAVLAGDDVAALALADRLVETRRAGEDVWGGLLKAAKNALETMYRGDFTNGVTSPMGDIDEGDVMAGRDMDRLQEAIRKAEGK